MSASASLADTLGATGAGDPDAVYDAFSAWTGAQGLQLYAHQEEAVIELLSGSNVILATPTGSGKSLVATAGILAAWSAGGSPGGGAPRVSLSAGGSPGGGAPRVSFYTAPIKALVSEKFFALCAEFGAENVGMLTGDAQVNPDAPIISCTAEVLANIALREGRDADVGLVVMDEFHYYGDPQRGWAWQVPLLELPRAQFLLMSATLGDVTELARDLTRRNGRETVVVDEAERPVPLDFSWSMEPLADTLHELVSTKQAPVYVVHFTQAAAVEHAASLLGKGARDHGWPVDKSAIAERLRGFRFGPGFGRTLSRLLRNGIGVHHAGMLPRYRRLVEQLAQAGLLQVVCGTDTLGVGINVPIRTVLFTGLVKFDGFRQRILRTREFLQIAGRAGRAGYDTAGYVVVQAPEHVIENERALAKAGEDPKKRRKVHRKQPPEGTPVWTRETFEKLVAGTPEKLPSRMRVDNSMLLNVVAREEDAFPVLRRLVRDNHEDRRSQLRLGRRALQLARSLVSSGVLVRLPEPDEHGRRYVLGVDLPEDFALHQPLSHFALAVLEVLDPESPDHTLDVVSAIESVLEAPRPVLLAQRRAARDEAMAAMKADGVEYEERMARLDEISWPQPLEELLEAAYRTYREGHPWLPEEGPTPKSVVREMYEMGMGFTDFVSRYGLSRSEGLVLRYLTDAYRSLRQTVPDAHRTPELDELVEWLGAVVRQTDSSLLDEWEALVDPEGVLRHAAEAGPDAPPPPARPITQQAAVFTRMVRNAMFRRVELIARDDVDELARVEQDVAGRTEPERRVVMDRTTWDDALEAYYAEHDHVRTGADARGPELFQVSEEHGAPAGTSEERDVPLWRVRQVLDDPEGHHDWVVEAIVDLPASDDLGEPVLATTGFRRL